MPVAQGMTTAYYDCFAEITQRKHIHVISLQVTYYGNGSTSYNGQVSFYMSTI